MLQDDLDGLLSSASALLLHPSPRAVTTVPPEFSFFQPSCGTTVPSDFRTKLTCWYNLPALHDIPH